MMQLICYLLPSVIAVWVTEIINKKNYTMKQWFYLYVLYVLFINLIIVTVLSTIYEGAEVYLSIAHFTNSLNMKYLAIALFLAVLLPFIFSFIKQTFSFNITIDIIDKDNIKEVKNGKTKKKKKSIKKSSK